MSTAAQDSRTQSKHHLLTHAAPSSARSIADAIVLKGDAVSLLTDRHGDVPLEGRHGYGLYRHDCRFLDGYELRIGGERGESLVGSAAKGFGGLFQLSNPKLADHDVPEGRIAIRWERVIDADTATLREEIRIRNNGRESHEFPVSFRFSARFEDIFVVRGMLDAERGTLHRPKWTDDQLTFAYDGIDDVRRFTFVSVQPLPGRQLKDGMRYDVEIGAGEEFVIEIAILARECPAGDRDAEQATRTLRGPRDRGADRNHRVRVNEILENTAEQWISQHVRLDSDSLELRDVFHRSIRDLGMLVTRQNEERYYAAGVPWFVALYGRDSLLSCLQTMAFVPEVATETLRLLAHYQGRDFDDWTDEAPGKILHELRVGELTRAGVVPYRPYYGSVDATPLFLILLVRHARWTGSMALVEELAPAVGAACDWLLEHGLNEAGLIAYDSTRDGGIVNQGWKDSGDAIVDEQGDVAEPPIALIEVQAYAWRACRDLAALLREHDRAAEAEPLEQHAAALRERVEQRFWCDAIGTYALAIDGSGQPLCVSSSNPGHTLWAGLPDESRARTVAARLMRNDMFNGWGVRTLSSDAAAYNPVGYHLGTVWPHDNAIIAAGCRRYGINDSALRIFEGLLSAATHFEEFRLPEVFAGFERDEFDVPVRYPVACHPQAWAAASIPGLLDALLGFEPDGFTGTLRLVRPILPPFVQQLELRDVRVGDHRCDLRIAHRDGRVELDEVSGDVNVQLEDDRV